MTLSIDAVKRLRLGADVRVYREAYNKDEGDQRTVASKPIIPPIRGIHIGWRGIPVGFMHYSYEEGNYLNQTAQIVVALVVTHPRKNPIRVLPEDLEII